jgi:hypothetical protein
MNARAKLCAATIAAATFASVALAQGSGLAPSSFGAISYAELEKWNSSGCSFAAHRGSDLIGIFDTQDKKRTALFKIDGKLVTVLAARKIPRESYWLGTVAGQELRMIKGRVDPTFKNDGGSEGGEGRIEWKGPGESGSMPIRWEEGC